jgi:ACR3 family arsenite efflux pump ArsB
MAPCTDWFLGFTRLAKGNVELGAALIPINMASQIILFPVYLWLFGIVIDYEINLSSLIEWFLQPLLAAMVLRILLHRIIDRVLPITQVAIPIVLSILVGLIFSANINQLLQHISIVPLLLSAIFVFFLLTYILGEGVAKMAKLNYPEHTLLTFTTSARNAPLMLGLATVALPDQPLIYATITIGMLIEFPHLTALRQLMLRRHNTKAHHANPFKNMDQQPQ